MNLSFVKVLQDFWKTFKITYTCIPRSFQVFLRPFVFLYVISCCMVYVVCRVVWCGIICFGAQKRKQCVRQKYFTEDSWAKVSYLGLIYTKNCFNLRHALYSTENSDIYFKILDIEYTKSDRTFYRIWKSKEYCNIHITEYSIEYSRSFVYSIVFGNPIEYCITLNIFYRIFYRIF